MSLERLIKRAKEIMALAVFSGVAAISGCAVSNNKFEDLPDNVLSKIAYDNLNMESPKRFFRKDLEKILNAKNEEGDIALILLPKSDYNNAFSTMPARRLYGEIVKNYRTFAFEIENDGQILEKVREVGAYGPISVLMICGHGDKDNIEFDNSPDLIHCQMNLSNPKDPLAVKKLFDAQIKYDDSRLDIRDVRRGELDYLCSYLKEGVFVILGSCSVGEGGCLEENLANVFSQSLRIRKNCRVVASKSICKMEQIHISFEDGKVKDVVIRDEGNTLRLYYNGILVSK